MQLQAFITRLAGFADKSEAQLDALAKSQTETADLRAQVAKLTEANSSAEKKFSAALTDEQTKSAAQAAELTTLKASVETEKNRANEAIAAQGLPAAMIPAASAEPAGKAEKLTLTEQCAAAKKTTLNK